LHTSGCKNTNKVRRALPITFSLPYYKQLLDYPRAIGVDKYDSFDKETRRKLGFDSIVTESICEWHEPSDKLSHKKLI
jgi:ectoine hydroxylase-related dioxygenase (phytanoyl-CoA dioxygenase family)